MRSSRVHSAALIAASLVPAPPLAEQQAPAAAVTGRVPRTFPTDDPVLKRIWSVGIDSSMAEWPADRPANCGNAPRRTDPRF